MKRADYSNYSIPIKGMPVGEQCFSFELGNEFFEEYENSEVVGADLSVDLVVVKSSALMNIRGTIVGSVDVECDRCLDELDVPIDAELALVIKFAKDIDDENDDIIIIDPSEGELNLQQLFYDTVILSLPIQRVHDKDKCNPEMIKKLESLNGGTNEDEEETESPFSILKKLTN